MKKLLLCIFFLCINQTHAATIGSAYIYGERMEGNACGLSNDAADAAIATVLRQNRITISQDKFSKIKFYHSITALDISSGCAVGVKLQVTTFGDFLVPSSPPKKLFSKIELCGNTYLLTGPKHDLQSRVSDSLRTMAEMCINEIGKE